MGLNLSTLHEKSRGCVFPLLPLILAGVNGSGKFWWKKSMLVLRGPGVALACPAGVRAL